MRNREKTSISKTQSSILGNILNQEKTFVEQKIITKW